MKKLNAARRWEQSDTYQWFEKEDEHEYTVLDLVFIGDRVCFNEIAVDLNDYSEQDMTDEIRGYYDSLDEVKAAYQENWRQIVAECIAEQTPCTGHAVQLPEAQAYLQRVYGLDAAFEPEE